MNKPSHFLMSLASSALFCGLVVSGSTLSAQQTPDQQTSPSAPAAQQPQQQPPAQTPDQAPAQPSQNSPDAQAQSQSQQSGGQVFAGTVTKSGDKYVLQMADGTAYDLDHQDLVKKYEGKQVRVKGTLDQDGKTIHITQ